MQKIQLYEIMSTDIVCIGPKTSVNDTIRKMRTNRTNSVLIAKDLQPIGIFTERDIVKSAASGKAKLDEAISELMTTPVITINESADLFEAIKIFIKHDIHHLAVINDGNRAIGMVTPSDLMNHIGSSHLAENLNILQSMKHVLITISEEKTFLHAIKEMARKSLSCLIISRNNKPVGIFTDHDVAELLLKRTHITKQKLRTIMKTPVQTVPVDATIQEITKVMSKHGVHYIVVVDEVGDIVGLINRFDLMRDYARSHIQNLKIV